MAIYGKGQMLGSGINPESFKQDYSGFTRAAEIQAQGIANLGNQIAGTIDKYGEMKKQQQLDERAVQKSKNVAKAIGDLIPDLKPTLQNSLMILDDKELPLSQRRAEADAISDILNLGIGEIRNRSSVELEKEKIGIDKAYREAQLEATKRAAAAAEQEAPPTRATSVSGGTQDVQWDKASRKWIPIQTSGLNATKTAGTGGGFIDFVKGLEGFRPKAYNDSDQISVGYGTKGVAGEVLNEQQATERLQSELAGHAKNVQDASNQMGITLNNNQLKALTSFDFNTGQGASLIKRFGKNPDALVSKMLEYEYDEGKKSEGLLKRRRIEAALFLTPDQQQATPQAPIMERGVGFKPDESQLESRGLNQEEVVAAGLPPGQYIGKFKGDKIVSIDPVPQEPDNIASAREKALDAPNLGYLDVAAASAKKLAPLNAALDLLNSKSVETGIFANYRTEARKLFGQDVSNEEQFNSLVGTLAMEALDLTKGSISNMEQKYFTEVLAPNISKTVDGNKKILEFRIGLAKRDIEIGKKVSEMFEKKATPIEIQREVSKIVEKNPLDKPMSSRASATGVGLDKEAIDALDFLNIPPAQ